MTRFVGGAPVPGASAPAEREIAPFEKIEGRGSSELRGQLGVEAAFDLVLAEMQKVVDKLNELGAEAFKNGDHDAARLILQEVELRQNLIPETVLLRNRWLDLQITKGGHGRRKRRGRQVGRLGPGEKTPNSFFRLPILKALVE